MRPAITRALNEADAICKKALAQARDLTNDERAKIGLAIKAAEDAREDDLLADRIEQMRFNVAAGGTTGTKSTVTARSFSTAETSPRSNPPLPVARPQPFTRRPPWALTTAQLHQPIYREWSPSRGRPCDCETCSPWN